LNDSNKESKGYMGLTERAYEPEGYKRLDYD